MKVAEDPGVGRGLCDTDIAQEPIDILVHLL